MTFEQWTQEMKRGISFQHDQSFKMSGWEDEHLEVDIEDEEVSGSMSKEDLAT
jgi:hypothetical protein